MQSIYIDDMCALCGSLVAAAGMVHSTSTTLDDIINELQLSYDANEGRLSGEHSREIPKLSVLLNLGKLLDKVSRQLEEAEQADAAVLGGNTDDDDSANESTQRGRRRLASDDEDDVGLAKRRKIVDADDSGAESDERIGDGDGDAAGEGKGDDEGDGEGEGHGEDADAEAAPAEDALTRDGATIPPVQEGHYTQDNDTRLKNPKLEFVTLQTLPAEAIARLGLFSEENNGLETHGKEWLKRKYGVASYPENDLQDLLPGPIPDTDFSKTKPPANQVQFTTFQTYLELFFRPFNPEDLDFLKEKHVMPTTAPFNDTKAYDPLVTPFLIPRLGSFYAESWSAEDAAMGAKLNSPYPQPGAGPDAFAPRGLIDGLTDDKLYTEEVSCGPLSSRLLLAILCSEGGEPAADAVKVEEFADEMASSPPSRDTILERPIATQLNLNSDYFRATSDKSDYPLVEERLKRELKYIGIFMDMPHEEGKKKDVSILDSDDWIRGREDDEVCAEMRALQRELKEVAARNKQAKKRLVPILEEQLAYQEYCTILEDLDKQVDQAYIKRMRVKNKKKKALAAGAAESTPAPLATMGLRLLLDKRAKWINNIGKLFKPAEVMKRAPTESIFGGFVESEEEIEEEPEDT